MERIEMKQAPKFIAIADEGEYNRGGGWDAAEEMLGIYDQLEEALEVLKAAAAGPRGYVREFYNPVMLGGKVLFPEGKVHRLPVEKKPAAPKKKAKAAVRK